MKTILVTGGCGFIGSNFVRQLLDSDRDLNPCSVGMVTSVKSSFGVPPYDPCSPYQANTLYFRRPASAHQHIFRSTYRQRLASGQAAATA